MGYLANDELERVEPDEREYPSLLARYGLQVDLDSVSWLVQTHHLVIARRTCISPETGMSNNSVERSSGQHGRRRQRGRREAFAAVRTVKAGRLFKKLLAALLIIAVAWLVSWLPGPPVNESDTPPTAAAVDRSTGTGIARAI
jgi:hypothetical protein